MSDARTWTRRGVHALGVLGICLVLLSIAASAQQGPAQLSQPAPSNTLPPTPQVELSPPGTLPTQPTLTVVPRSAAPDAKSASPSRNEIPVTFTANLTDSPQRIEQGLVWRIYPKLALLERAAAPKPKPLLTSREAAPTLPLAPGDYSVAVTYGRAYALQRLSVRGPEAQIVKVEMNAGGLRVTAALTSGEALPPSSVTYDVLADERDQYGNRSKVITGAKPGTVIRLNSGIYQLVSTYGDANALVRSDVTVEVGKITEAKVVHAAAKVAFKLVTRAGGEAIADTRWNIAVLKAGQPGPIVKESVGALPTHTLAPGDYAAIAKLSGQPQPFRKDFRVKAGDTVLVEIVKP